MNRVCRVTAALLWVTVVTPLIDASDVSPGNYTVEEKQAIQKLRAQVKSELYRDYMERDAYLIRWVQDQNLDVDKAKKKLLTSLKWRKANNIDAVVDEDFSDIFKHCPYSMDGRDKSSRPIITVAVGPCPVRRLVLSGKGQKLVRYVYIVFERAIDLVEQEQVKGNPISDFVAILDMNGFNYREHACLQCIPVIIEFVSAYEYHYPRYFHSFFAINSPRSFENLVTILWPVLSEHSRRVLHVIGFDRNQWQRALLKNISPAQLTPQYGGTKGTRNFQK